MRPFQFFMSCCAVLTVLVAGQAMAAPNLQVYIDGATAGTIGEDEDTWFFTGSSFDLLVAGKYGPTTTSITGGTLVFMVPEGEQGTVTVGSTDGDPITLITLGNGNPIGNPDTDILTDVAGDDGYATKSFAPDNFNNHYPFQDDVSDFILFDIGSFANIAGDVDNYDADTGTISQDNADGETKKYQISFTGFSQVHFDVYALFTTQNGPNSNSSWNINPGSHDATAKTNGVVIPLPAAAWMGLSTLGGLAAVRLTKRRRNA